MADSDRGRVMKVLFADEQGELVAKSTQQLPEDPFGGRLGQGLVEPPLPLEQLIFLAERHPVHSAAIEQKAADVIGTGWEWVPDDEESADEERRDDINEWFESLAGDETTMHELLLQLWLDVETLNVGYWEVGRDPQGIAREVYHVPGHTVRFHRDGMRLAQARDGRRAWFKYWGKKPEKVVDSRTGGLKDEGEVEGDRVANELLVVKRVSRRSSWYGVPGYVSSIGWITLAIAVRDENLYFFANRREPRWAIILTNIEDDPDLEEDLANALKVDHRQPYRNLIIPIAGPGEVEFKELSKTGQEGSFEKLENRCDARVLVAHRIPPERLGMVRVGPLGGNVAAASSRIYREAVISTSQAFLSARINRFIQTEYRKARGLSEDAPLGWTWAPVELDLTEEREDVETTAKLFDSDIIILNEARGRLKMDPLPDEDPRGNMLRSEVKAKLGLSTDPEEGEEVDPLDQRLQDIDTELRQLLSDHESEHHEGDEEVGASSASG